MADLACVDPDIVHLVWPKVSGWLRDAMRRGGLGSFEVLENSVLSGGALLWVFMDGQIKSATVTQVGVGEGGKVCEILACGGADVLSDLQFIGKIETYARNEGCRAVRIMGRRGWVRALKEYKQTRVVLEKELN